MTDDRFTEDAELWAAVQNREALRQLREQLENETPATVYLGLHAKPDPAAEFGAAIFDEAHEISEEDVITVNTRLRQRSWWRRLRLRLGRG